MFQAALQDLLPERPPGSPSTVYFQAPENTEMVYPCIVYDMNYADTKFADNSPYSHTKRYQVTVIDEDPDSEIPDKVAKMPLSLFQRFFIANGLNHYIYNVYF